MESRLGRFHWLESDSIGRSRALAELQAVPPRLGPALLNFLRGTLDAAPTGETLCRPNPFTGFNGRPLSLFGVTGVFQARRRRSWGGGSMNRRQERLPRGANSKSGVGWGPALSMTLRSVARKLRRPHHDDFHVNPPPLTLVRSAPPRVACFSGREGTQPVMWRERCAPPPRRRRQHLLTAVIG